MSCRERRDHVPGPAARAAVAPLARQHGLTWRSKSMNLKDRLETEVSA